MVRKAADRDVDEIAEYLGVGSPRAVDKFYDSLAETFADLETRADIGQRFDFADGSETGLRFWRMKSFGDYLVVYRIVGEIVWVYRSTGRGI
jgi:plasmid stabilization system protein ParE